MSELELIRVIQTYKRIWICGNGGSAATAEHFATDLIKKGYPAIALTNSAVISMIANDYGYKYIFSKQLEALFDEDNDLLITISCSGTSPNIKEAIKYVKQVADDPICQVYSFETFGKNKDYAELENKHLKFAHYVASEL